MLRLIVTAPPGPGEMLPALRTFDVNSPDLEDLLTRSGGKVAVEAVEVVPGRARKAKAKTPPATPPIPCQYEKFLAVFAEELDDLPQPTLRTGKTWQKRKQLMDTMWDFILTSTTSDGRRRANDEETALAWLRQYFRRSKRSDFLMGRGARAGVHENWRADFDFLVDERGWVHVLERTQHG
jgi:hypothetical protein